MRILTCTYYRYYGFSKGIEPQFYYLYKVPLSMGHEVDFFDYQTASAVSKEQMRRTFLALVRGGKYDAVFIATAKDEFDEATLHEAKKHSALVAWNSDDEWRWKDYSEKMISWFTFMVTNDPRVYQRNKSRYSNLLHAQWACTGFWNGLQTKKDIPFSFVGQFYGKRDEQVRRLKKIGLVSFGMGSGNLSDPEIKLTGFRKLKNDLSNAFIKRFRPDLARELSILNFEQVNALWNRTRISFTPLDSSSGNVIQIKSRVFDMGLSGTVMLAHRSDALDGYYEPDKEYVPFHSIDECADKAKFYMKHAAESEKIGEAYARRTSAQHLWKHRIEHVLRESGLD
ncbi:MAG TPA: glycosyltransferase [Chitinophagales bacterium]|nr:glycosyltransferase [Chitinophagales bacterium]